MDPAIQYGAYADFAYVNGLIRKETQNSVNAAYPECRKQTEKCDAEWRQNAHPEARGECLAALQYCQVRGLRMLTERCFKLCLLWTACNVFPVSTAPFLHARIQIASLCGHVAPVC